MAEIYTNIFWIISVISWVLLIITEIIAIAYLNSKYIIWTFYRIPIIDHLAITEQLVWPLQMTEAFIFTIFIILLILTIAAFGFFMFKSFIKKEKQSNKGEGENVIIKGMLGTFSKFHFIPLLCASALFIIGESIGVGGNHEKMNLWGLIFVVLGLISLIFIYMKTDFNSEWLPSLIKKGFYSCLISLEWYYFCYDICNIKINKTSGNGDKIRDSLEVCSGLLNVILGIGGLFFVIFFKDLAVAGMNFIIHLGLAVFLFSNSKGAKYNGRFELIVDIYMMVLFVFAAIFIFIKYQKECLK